MKRQCALFLTILILCVGFIYLKIRSAGAQTGPAATGKIALASDRNSPQPSDYEIYVMNPDGSNQVPLTNNSTDDYSPSFSRDGLKIAFVSNRTETPQIYVMNADGSNQTQLTNSELGNFDPAFSPDGSKIAFVSYRDGNAEIYAMDADGTDQTRLTENSSFDYDPTYLPNGSKIVFVSNRTENSQIYTMNPDGSQQRRMMVNSTDDFDPSISPDGTLIAFTSLVNDNPQGGIFNYEIYVADIMDGGTRRRLTFTDTFETNPSFSADGSKIAFDSRPGSVQIPLDSAQSFGNIIPAEIYVMNANGADQRQLTENPANDYDPSWGRLPCTYTLEPTGASVPATGVTNATFTVVTQADCEWEPEVSDNSPWLTAVRSGNQVLYTAEANNLPETRTGTIRVADKIFIVTQEGMYAISGRITDEISGAGVPGVNVTVDGLTFSVLTNADGFYTFPNLARGNYTVRPVLANRTFNPPATPVQITNANVGNINFILVALRYSIAGRVTNSLNDPVANVAIRANGQTVATTNSNGDYSIGNILAGSYTISPFLNGATFTPGSRAVQVTNANVNNADFTLNCTYALSASSREVAPGGAQGSFTVTSPCRWSASVSSPDSWITADGGGSGNGAVSYTVSANAAPVGRVGRINVGDKVFIIAQSPSQTNCLFSLSETNINLSTAGSSGVFTVKTTAGCQWAVTSENNWIRPQTQGGTQTGNVAFTVDPGPARAGRIRVQGRVYTVYQSDSDSVPANDNFENAEILAASAGEAITNNTRATRQSNEPQHAAQSGNNSIWYKWTAPENGVFNFTTSGSISNQGTQPVRLIDTVLAIYADQALSTALPVEAANDDARIFDKGSNLTFNAEAGRTYLIAVDSKAGAISNTGMIKLRWRKVIRAYRFYALTGNGEISSQEPTIRVFRSGGEEIPNAVEKVAPGTFDVYLPSDNLTYNVRFTGEGENSAVRWSPETHVIRNSTLPDPESVGLNASGANGALTPEDTGENVSRPVNSNFNVIGYVLGINNPDGLRVYREVQEGPFPADKIECPTPESIPAIGVVQYVCGTLLDTNHVFTAYKAGTGFQPERIIFPKLEKTIFPEDNLPSPNFNAFAQPTGNLQGSVRRGADNAPLGGVTVTLRRNGEPWQYSLKSTESGNFTFAGLKAATYTLTGELDGYTFDPVTVVIEDGGEPFATLIGVTGGNCTFGVSMNTFNFAVNGGLKSFTIMPVSSGCEWSATVDAAAAGWLRISTPAAGSLVRGASTVTISADPNDGQAPREPGIIKINNRDTIIVNQAGLASCNFALDREDSYFQAAVGGGSFVFSAAHRVCRENVQSLLRTDVDWITNLRAQGDRIFYDVLENAGAETRARVGKITLAGATLVVIQTARAVDLPVGFDFTQDKKADVAVYRPSSSTWYVLESNNLQVRTTQWGNATDKIVPGDFDGDGRLDYAVWRRVCNIGGETRPCLMTLSSGDETVNVSIWDRPDGVPVFGDWDGDKKTDVAIYRPDVGIWNVRYSDSPSVISEFYFGTAGDIPVAGDFDGDRRQDYAIFRPSTGDWWIRKSRDSSVATVHFGSPGDVPVASDFDGDGRADYAVFRPSNGTWYLLRSALFDNLEPVGNRLHGFRAVQFGAAGDIPTAADMDGDGRTDIAVYRPSTGTWYVLRSDGTYYAFPFGVPEDRPIPSAFINMP